MDTSTLLENQLLATKFYVPVAPGTLISRPRLSALLDQSLEHPLTLISAPAGFGKTTLLAAWGQALPASNPRLAWVSLDKESYRGLAGGLTTAHPLHARASQSPHAAQRS
jgi:ATP/maltotriose-dependent transcriptional regulator MalT